MKMECFTNFQHTPQIVCAADSYGHNIYSGCSQVPSNLPFGSGVAGWMCHRLSYTVQDLFLLYLYTTIFTFLKHCHPVTYKPNTVVENDCGTTTL